MSDNKLYNLILGCKKWDDNVTDLLLLYDELLNDGVDESTKYRILKDKL